MSLPVKSARAMRIVALPLTRARPTFGALTYYQFVTPPPANDKPPTLFKRSTDKAASLWANMGTAPEGNWKLKIYRYGERLIDKIEFEELALKSLDPGLGPKLTKLGDSEVHVEDKGQDQPLSIPLYYPQASPSPLAHLRELVAKRAPKHRKGFLTWMFVSPLMIPFALIPLIPVIPNLPFFYCVWRSWSHYQAYKASEYVQSLLDKNAILPEPSPELEAIYTTNQPTSDADSDASSTPPESTPLVGKQTLLLSRDAVPRIVELFSLPPTSGAEIYRAMEQAAVRSNSKEP